MVDGQKVAGMIEKLLKISDREHHPLCNFYPNPLFNQYKSLKNHYLSGVLGLETQNKEMCFLPCQRIIFY